jgi:TRAP-type C4-dicarboxylate transport system permease small subunit
MSSRSDAGPGFSGILDRSIQWVALVADHLSALICAVLIVATTAAMIIYQLGIAIDWLDDMLRALLIWLVYLGAVPLCLNNDHISMDALYFHYPKGVRKAVDVIIAVTGIGLCLFTAKSGFDSMRHQFVDHMLLPGGEIPAWPQTLAIPLAFTLMAVGYLSYLVFVITGRRLRRKTESTRTEVI